ncbi:MAG: hypothetical protein M1548_00055 [Actinobacteria bacterium]|nr:hypothetical protein [Actinomycetota bacterium]
MGFLNDTLVGGLTVGQVLAIVIPLVVIQWGAVVAALASLRKQPDAQVRGGRVLWVIILIASLASFPAGMLGAVAYFVIGRKPNERD